MLSTCNTMETFTVKLWVKTEEFWRQIKIDVFAENHDGAEIVALHMAKEYGTPGDIVTVSQH